MNNGCLRSSLLTALAVASLGTATLAHAQINTPCINSVVVETEGHAAHADSELALDAAVTSAISTAVASVRGLRISSEATMTDWYRSGDTSSGSPASGASGTQFEQRISTKFAGNVVTFDILSTTQPDAYGMVGASVRTTVCLDPRLVVSVTGSGDAEPAMLVSALTAHVAPQAQNLGWWLIPRHVPGIDVARHDAFEIVLETGATAVLQGAIVGQVLERSEVSVSFEVVITYSLVDVTTGSILASDALLSARGVGYTVGAAVQNAMGTLSAELGRAVTIALVAADDLPVARFEFAPIRRAALRMTIADRLSTISGVIDVTDVRLGNDQVLVIDLTTNGDVCAIADELAAWTRIGLTVQDCGGGFAAFRVYRE